MVEMIAREIGSPAHVEQRRFPATRRADDADELTLLDAQTDVIENGELGVCARLGKRLGQVTHGDGPGEDRSDRRLRPDACHLDAPGSMRHGFCAARGQVASCGRQANTRRAHTRNAKRSIKTITIMKLTPQASIMSTRVSWNQYDGHKEQSWKRKKLQKIQHGHGAPRMMA
jgi:hypothetical protein